jgi:hypothetical protein
MFNTEEELCIRTLCTGIAYCCQGNSVALSGWFVHCEVRTELMYTVYGVQLSQEQTDTAWFPERFVLVIVCNHYLGVGMCCRRFGSLYIKEFV